MADDLHDGSEVSSPGTTGTLAMGETSGGLAHGLLVGADGTLAVSATFSGTIGTVAQGAPNTLANAWPVEVTDGTNVLGTVAHPLNVTGAGGGGVSAVDESAWTAGTSTLTPSGGVFNDSATALTSGQQGTERLTPNRAAHVNIRNQAGTELATASNPVRVDPTGTTTQPVSGTVTANQGTANTAANSWQVEVTDGTNVLGTSSHPIRNDPTGTTPQPVTGFTAIVQATFTRPSNTTAYSAGQVVGNTGTAALIQFSGAGRISNGSGYITKLRAAVQVTAGTPITPRLRLWLWSTNTPTPIADGAAMNIFNSGTATRIGAITLPALSTEGASSDSCEAYIDTVKTPFACTGAQSSLYGLLETLDAFTPISAASVLVELGIEQN